MKKIKKVNDYKVGENSYLIEEGPGFFRLVPAKVEDIKESKTGVRISLSGSSIPTRNWIMVEDNRIKALDSSGTERLIYDDYDFAYSIHQKKLRDYTPTTKVLRITDDTEETTNKEEA